MHCGFCLQACPTYLTLEDENDSPRGRIVLMHAMVEGTLPVGCSGKDITLAIIGKIGTAGGTGHVIEYAGDTIRALLTRLGAHDSVLAWEERRMRREVRATANRLANFDDANLRRSARAAVAAGARVERALEILADEVPDHLGQRAGHHVPLQHRATRQRALDRG